MQALGALLMSATALVVYLWGRGPLGEWWAVAAAGLTLAVPDLAYSGLVMSEVAIYPVATLALWAIASALARPSPVRQALVAARDRARAGDARPAGRAHPDAVRRRRAPVRLRAVARAGTTPGRPPRQASRACAPSRSWATRSPGAGTTSSARTPRPPAATSSARWRRTCSGTSRGVFILVAGIPLVALAAMTIECVRRASARPGRLRARRDHARLDAVPRARGRNVRLALGRPRHAARPAAGRAAADARVRALDRTRCATTAPVDPARRARDRRSRPCSCRWADSPSRSRRWTRSA